MADPTAVDYASFLEDLQSQRAALVKVIEGLDMAIAGLSQVVPNSAGAGSVLTPSTPGGRRPTIQSDTFFRLKIGEAAKKYLEMVGQPPRSIDAITEALNRGGLRCKAGSVATIIGREAPEQGFVKVGGDWALESWYSERRENGAP